MKSFVCSECGKEFVIPYTKNYIYKKKICDNGKQLKKYFCSYHCMSEYLEQRKIRGYIKH